MMNWKHLKHNKEKCEMTTINNTQKSEYLLPMHDYFHLITPVPTH